MTYTYPLADFFKDTKINYNEDLFDQIYIGDCDVNTSDIVYHLPSKYETLTEDIIDGNTLLKDALQRAYNRAYESGVLSACHTAQNKAVEEYADRLVEVVNQITENALNNITIDWVNEKVTIDYNEKEACEAIFEIINGEGIFQFETVNDFVASWDGEVVYSNAVENYTHYLLNAKLIQDIYGFVKSARFEWSCDDCDFDADYFAECIEEELSEIDPDHIRALATSKLEESMMEVYQLKELKLIK